MKPFPLYLNAGGEVHALSLRPEIKLVAVITAFCDETKTDERSDLSFVGGYIFDAEGQKAFTERWATVLKPLSSRGIRYFHASPCNAGVDEFESLNFAERCALFGDLISLIRSTAICAIAISLFDKDFKDIIRRNKFQEYTGTKYTACVLRAISGIAQWAHDGKLDGKISYRFESGNEDQPEADFMLRQIEKNPELSEQLRYGGHAFEPKYSLLPLQAADLWLWLCQRMWNKKERNPYWDNLRQQPGAIPHYVHKMSSASVGFMALMNMTNRIKSNREYEKQTGHPRTYTI